MQIVEGLKTKHKKYEFQEIVKDENIVGAGQGSGFTVSFILEVADLGKTFKGQATDPSKQRARQLAAQRFLKTIYTDLTYK